ncbi:ATP-dependent DNA helicase sgs1, partial [Chytridiales sp. JEL 0842]
MVDESPDVPSLPADTFGDASMLANEATAMVLKELRDVISLLKNPQTKPPITAHALPEDIQHSLGTHLRSQPATVPTASNRQHELHKVMFSNQKRIFGKTEFKSAELFNAIAAVLPADRHVVIHLPTGSGKTSIMQHCALFNQDTTTLVAIPLDTLISDLLSKFNALGIDCSVYTGENTPLSTVVLVHYQVFQERFKQFLHWTLHAPRLLGKEGPCRIIFDEAHTLFVWQKFMLSKPQFQTIVSSLKLPTVFMSGTFLREHIEYISNTLALHLLRAERQSHPVIASGFSEPEGLSGLQEGL